MGQFHLSPSRPEAVLNPCFRIRWPGVQHAPKADQQMAIQATSHLPRLLEQGGFSSICRLALLGLPLVQNQGRIPLLLDTP